MRKAKSPTLGIRPGVKARVMVPERFVRCGYELTPKIAGELLWEKHQDDIVAFFEKLGITEHGVAQFKSKNLLAKSVVTNRAVTKFLGDLGYLYVAAKGFGGRERKIFSIPEPRLEDKTVRVAETRQVMIGTYYGPSGGYSSYDGEYDYEPGGLADQSSIKIARVYICEEHGTITSMNDDIPHQQWKGLWVDARDLEKIEDDRLVHG